MTHPLTQAGRIRYLPSYSAFTGLDYTPPSWFKQRAIDAVLLSCIFFPAYRRHKMRERPIYKFLDIHTGEVRYYNDLNEYKEAIYNRLPSKLVPEARPGFFTRYEFDFRDRAYAEYLSYEPYFLRMRNWLTFNNWRSNRFHLSHRLKDTRMALNSFERPNDDSEEHEDIFTFLYGMGTFDGFNLHSDRQEYGTNFEFASKLAAKPFREQAFGTEINTDNHLNLKWNNKDMGPDRLNPTSKLLVGDIGLEYDTDGPRTMLRDADDVTRQSFFMRDDDTAQLISNMKRHQSRKGRWHGKTTYRRLSSPTLIDEA